MRAAFPLQIAHMKASRDGLYRTGDLMRSTWAMDRKDRTPTPFETLRTVKVELRAAARWPSPSKTWILSFSPSRTFTWTPGSGPRPEGRTSFHVLGIHALELFHDSPLLGLGPRPSSARTGLHVFSAARAPPLDLRMVSGQDFWGPSCRATPRVFIGRMRDLAGERLPSADSGEPSVPGIRRPRHDATIARSRRRSGQVPADNSRRRGYPARARPPLVAPPDGRSLSGRPRSASTLVETLPCGEEHHARRSRSPERIASTAWKMARAVHPRPASKGSSSTLRWRPSA
jgi:hypothetical protein